MKVVQSGHTCSTGDNTPDLGGRMSRQHHRTLVDPVHLRDDVQSGVVAHEAPVHQSPEWGEKRGRCTGSSPHLSQDKNNKHDFYYTYKTMLQQGRDGISRHPALAQRSIHDCFKWWYLYLSQTLFWR